MRLCPWSLALASSITVVGLEGVSPRKGCPWPWPRIFFVSLALSLVSYTPPLVLKVTKSYFAKIEISPTMHFTWFSEHIRSHFFKLKCA